MPGGLLNLVSYGNQNIILNGNPSKTFFKCTYAKYTNFGLQKFRIDFEGSKNIRMTEPSTFTFKIPRYGDLLMDTYLVLTLPTIWSSILPPTCELSTNPDIKTPLEKSKYIWNPYEFKWIKNIGTQMIKRMRFIVGGQVIQEYTGDYLYNLVERDFNGTKKLVYYKMSGNVPELNDPANAYNRNGKYPNVWPTNSPNYSSLGPEPSIHGRKIYIPINIWFTLASKMAFPLVSLQYNELEIEVELRPVQELYVIRDVENVSDPNKITDTDYVIGNYIQPNSNNKLHQFYRFIQPPPEGNIENMRDQNYYINQSTNWAADIHLISTYAFLSDDEVSIFAANPQQYLIKEVYHYHYDNVVGSKRVNLDSLGLISSWMWFFRRTDAFLRNEWSNYTNWPYGTLPNNIIDPRDCLVDISIPENTPTFYKTITIQLTEEEIYNEFPVEFQLFIGTFNFEGYKSNGYPYYSNSTIPNLFLYILEISEVGEKKWAFTQDIQTEIIEDDYILTNHETLINTHILFYEKETEQGTEQGIEMISYSLLIVETEELPLCFTTAKKIKTPCNPNTSLDPSINPSGKLTGYKITGNFSPDNVKNIMLTWGLSLDGKYRENVFDAGIFNYIEKYTKSEGSSPDGLYCYNFALHTNPRDFQPSGAINLSKFKNIEFEFTTYTPPLDPNAQTLTICDAEGNTIGINKPVWRIYDYTYDLIVMEERYNILTFTSGNAGLTYTR